MKLNRFINIVNNDLSQYKTIDIKIKNKLNKFVNELSKLEPTIFHFYSIDKTDFHISVSFNSGITALLDIYADEIDNIYYSFSKNKKPIEVGNKYGYGLIKDFLKEIKQILNGQN